MEEGLSFKGRAAGINPKVVLYTWAELPRYWITLFRSCVIGWESRGRARLRLPS
jgi:hypothetical protein